MTILEGMINRNPNTIIAGDFNSRHEDFGHDSSDESGRRLMDLMNKHRFTKLNDNEPTYYCSHSPTIDVKDLIFSSPEISKKFEEFWV